MSGAGIVCTGGMGKGSVKAWDSRQAGNRPSLNSVASWDRCGTELFRDEVLTMIPAGSRTGDGFPHLLTGESNRRM
jgi:hypothetical protein